MKNKLISRAEVGALGARLRSEGRQIAFANGCFDLLHVGHLRYLRGAKDQGDVLVVGVNSDPSVHQLKGAGRPILPAEARAELVAAFACVDYVLIFDGPTASEVLEDLRPHVHCKGSDYTAETVPEKDVMKKLGGTVRIVGDAKNHSTRDVLQRISNIE